MTTNEIIENLKKINDEAEHILGTEAENTAEVAKVDAKAIKEIIDTMIAKLAPAPKRTDINVRATLRDNLHPDTISKNKAGNLVLRWGFFYTHGMTSDKYREKVSNLLTGAKVPYQIVKQGKVLKAFRGGASVANQSHFFVEVKIMNDGNCPTDNQTDRVGQPIQEV